MFVKSVAGQSAKAISNNIKQKSGMNCWSPDSMWMYHTCLMKDTKESLFQIEVLAQEVLELPINQILI